MVSSAGEEVTISYGAFPNEVFLVYFGFLPSHNPHDAVILFDDLEALVSCHNSLLQLPADAGSNTLRKRCEAVKAAPGAADWHRWA